MDRGPDALVSPAATDVRHRGIDLGISRLRFLAQQRRRRHDLSRLAVAALRHVLGDPRLLDAMRRRGAEAFDGNNWLGPDGGDRHDAGPSRLTAQMHGAGAALRDAAAELGAGETEVVAQDPEERRV